MAATWQPSYFPVALRVNVPGFGENKSTQHEIKIIPIKKASFTDIGHSFDVNNDYVKKISSDLSFHQDVIVERSSHTLPYSTTNFNSLFDSSSVVKMKAQLKTQHNARFCRMSHCHQSSNLINSTKIFRSPKLNPLVVTTSAVNDHIVDGHVIDKLHKVDPQSANNLDKHSEKNDWDEYLLSLLSVNTAQYITSDIEIENLSISRNMELKKRIRQWYGEFPYVLDLVPDDPRLQKENPPIPLDFYLVKSTSTNKEKKRWRLNTPFLRKLEEKSQTPLPTDPYDEKNDAAFYRLPLGERRYQKNAKLEELTGAMNATATCIEVHRKVLTPPPTMRDFLNPRVGDKFLDTNNEFERDWLTGGVQLYQSLNAKKRDENNIVMSSLNCYKRQLEPLVPPINNTGTRGENHVVHKLKRGPRRWIKLPEPFDNTGEMVPDNQTQSNTQGNAIMKSSDREILDGRKKVRSNAPLLKIVDDWRSKWHLNQKFSDATVQELIKDMNDIHSIIKLQAIMTCAKAASYVSPVLSATNVNESTTSCIGTLPEPLFQGLEILLQDTNHQVRMASAICLYTLRRPCNLADDILRTAMLKGSTVDRWAAVQCFANYGIHDSDVVGELVDQLMSSEDNLIHEQAIHLLSELSKHTRLVHGLLAERLNSASWRYKVIACKALPVLHGKINNDLAQKLSFLMWNDINQEVRVAAAQTLGKTGHGKDVHNELRERLQGKERMRADAIHKLGYLGIMTARLLPIFLKTFDDPYVSVRQESCMACGRLKLSDERILEKLLYLATYDSIWKVKALAIQALGEIGLSTPEIRKCILWALRYEAEPSVRAEACHVAMEMGWSDKEVVTILCERYLVESSDLVRKEIVHNLQMIGISAADDIDMVAQIKSEVRRLNVKSRICHHIQVNEANDNHEELRKQLIASPLYSPRSTQDTLENLDEPQLEPNRVADSIKTSRSYSDEKWRSLTPGSPITSSRISTRPATTVDEGRITTAVSTIPCDDFGETHENETNFSSHVTSFAQSRNYSRSQSSKSRKSNASGKLFIDERNDTQIVNIIPPPPIMPDNEMYLQPSQNENEQLIISAADVVLVGPTSEFNSAKSYRLPRNSCYIKPLSIERCTSTFHVSDVMPSALLDPRRMPLKDETRCELELISQFEGLDLKPLSQSRNSNEVKDADKILISTEDAQLNIAQSSDIVALERISTAQSLVDDVIRSSVEQMQQEHDIPIDMEETSDYTDGSIPQ